ncbi:MAG TPA: alpha/beta fold hydrolase, partial [Jatrophihabitantaceae bacterium]|nr:alpha/beta fold hydrolase [Jatrophihabitantaceae bacterium]
MDTQTTRIFRPARIVALVLITLAALALGYLHFAPGKSALSVPAGAKAGDLTLKPCRYGTESGRYAADCGTLVVPENRAATQSRLIALPVIRIRARSAHPAEPIFRLEGGPGITNMRFGKASQLADRHDVVLVGYRGVDGSVRLDCPEVGSAMKRSGDLLGEKSMRARADAYRQCAKRLQRDGVDLAGYTLPQRVDDLEAARRALGYQRVDLLSESAGTRTAMIYSWRYPNSIQRSVMIGANPPGHFLWDPRTTDEQIHRYASVCAQDASCRKRTDDLAASMEHTAAHPPSHWWFLPINQGNVRIASFWGLMHATSAAEPISAPMILGSWLSAAKGDASGFWFQSLLAELAFPEAQIWGDVAAVSRADAHAARHYFSAGRDNSILGNAGTEFLWTGGRLLGAWPGNAGEDQYTRVQTSQVRTLLISGELDFATPPELATKELLPHLPNGHQVVLPGIGHTDDFWSYQPEARSRMLNAFFDSGTVDESRYRPEKVDFTPDVTQTALGTGIGATMIGLAALVVLTLLWMPYRVHRRGGFGRKAGVLLRLLYPLVLGLGGWFVGAIIVMTSMPSVPLDNALLAVLCVGIPIGLGIYWAWVRRDWSANTKIAGLVAAAVGALDGAWLGFQATTGLLALVTAIVGAAAGANLALILLDVCREHRARRPVLTDHPSRTETSMSTKRTSHLAARMGHWSATHWKTAVFGWLAFVVAATAIGMLVGQKTTSMQSTNVGESHRADRILQQAGFTQSDPLTEIVVVQSQSATVRDASFRSTVDDVVRAVTPFATIHNIRSPFDRANAGQISADGHTALVEWDMKGGEQAAAKNIDALTRTTASVAKAHPGFFVGEAGTVSSSKAISAMFGKQLAQAGERSIPLTLLVLLLVFGGLVAASIPLLLALSSVIATTGLIAPISHLIAVDGNVTAVILLVGLAVGVDYTLFYLKREREERAAGRAARAALEAAAATSGRSVLISGLTVIVAMAGMLFTRDQTFMGFGIATMLVVAVAMIGSLTVVPALLAKFGDRVEKGRIPVLGRLRRPGGNSRVWAKLLTPALRHPVVSTLVAGGVLVVLALPVFSLHT